MATIRKRVSATGKPKYQVQVRVQGHAPLAQSFSRKADAVAWATETEAAMRGGRYIGPSDYTLADLINQWIRTELHNVTPKNRKQRTQQLGWWSEQLGDRELHDLEPAEIYRAIRNLAAGKYHGKPLRSSTVNRYRSALSVALNLGVVLGWLRENPCRKVPAEAEPKGRLRFLSEEELASLLAASDRNRRYFMRQLVVLAVTTGGRKMELMTLRWRDIDLERGRLTFEVTKNGQRRSVPIGEQAITALKELGKVRVLGSDCVFPRRSGKRHLPFPENAWRDTRKDAGLVDFRFHDLRHTAASYLAMSGATLTDIAHILGHRKLATTLRYAHLTEDHRSEVVRRMEAKFLVVGPEKPKNRRRLPSPSGRQKR